VRTWSRALREEWRIKRLPRGEKEQVVAGVERARAAAKPAATAKRGAARRA
jgi:predicted GIY-YIG superfamily endonuclease